MTDIANQQPVIGTSVLVAYRPKKYPSGAPVMNSHHGHIAKVTDNRRRWNSDCTFSLCGCGIRLWLWPGCQWTYIDDAIKQQPQDERGSAMPNLIATAVRTKEGWVPQVVDGVAVDSTIVWEAADLTFSEDVKHTDAKDEEISAKDVAVKHAQEAIDRVVATAFQEWADA